MRKALVTGSSRGLGKAIAIHLIKSGYDVFIHGTTMNSPSRLGEYPGNLYDLAQDIGAVSYYVGDLSQGAKSLPNNRFDIVVCAAGGDIGYEGVESVNAGRPQHNDALNICGPDTCIVLDRNILSTIRTCQRVAPHMIELGHGCIILIGSIYGFEPTVEGAVYAAAKAAVHHYGRCLAKQLQPHNVRVNVVAPGPTVTPRFLASRKPNPALQTGKGLVRYSTPEELAILVEKVISTPHMTGQIITLDGGLTL